MLVNIDVDTAENEPEKVLGSRGVHPSSPPKSTLGRALFAQFSALKSELPLGGSASVTVIFWLSYGFRTGLDRPRTAGGSEARRPRGSDGGPKEEIPQEEGPGSSFLFLGLFAFAFFQLNLKF